jgi:hypothetical protein
VNFSNAAAQADTLGLLINFGEDHLKNGIERIVNGLAEQTSPSSGS